MEDVWLYWIWWWGSCSLLLNAGSLWLGPIYESNRFDNHLIIIIIIIIIGNQAQYVWPANRSLTTFCVILNKKQKEINRWFRSCYNDRNQRAIFRFCWLGFETLKKISMRFLYLLYANLLWRYANIESDFFVTEISTPYII